MINPKYIFFFWASFVFIIAGSCSKEKSPYEKIDFFLNQSYQVDLQRYDHLIVINEEGDCLNCNNIFSKTISGNIHKPNVLFLISTPGANIDVSTFINGKYDNVLLDFNNEFFKLDIIEKCAIINLGDNQIDTIINIDLSNVNSVESYMD